MIKNGNQRNGLNFALELFPCLFVFSLFLLLLLLFFYIIIYHFCFSLIIFYFIYYLFIYLYHLPCFFAGFMFNLFFIFYEWYKKCLKISKRQSEAITTQWSKEKDIRTNTDLQSTTQRTNDRTTLFLLKKNMPSELLCSGSLSSSDFTKYIHYLK